MNNMTPSETVWIDDDGGRQLADAPGCKRRAADLTKSPGLWLKIAAVDPSQEYQIEQMVSRYGYLVGPPDPIKAWEELVRQIKFSFSIWATLSGSSERLDQSVLDTFQGSIEEAQTHLRGKGYVEREREFLSLMNQGVARHVTAIAVPNKRKFIDFAVEPSNLAGYALIEFANFIQDPLQKARRCDMCGDLMTHKSANARLCSDRCRMAASRAARGVK
jgi:hypothetical protein